MFSAAVGVDPRLAVADSKVEHPPPCVSLLASFTHVDSQKKLPPSSSRAVTKRPVGPTGRQRLVRRSAAPDYSTVPKLQPCVLQLSRTRGASYFFFFSSFRSGSDDARPALVPTPMALCGQVCPVVL
ncbi:hypothetical protein HPB50_016517 [Hyalomma asiaticum]|uniref:Uncharacterized protein n=1 Tax=Hyalomma asiaticum TaxID=266040 RepID=A0ACB7SZ67_HYAAI|nr:hypothetical protein HPB50_016517 [Hyalomma asiaticum]